MSSLGLSVASTASVYAVSGSGSDVCNAIGSGVNCDQGTGPSIGHVIKVVINILSIVVGIIAIIMIIISGLRYVTSGGDANNVSAAKNTLMYALIGLVVVVFAQAIVQFVLKNVK